MAEGSGEVAVELSLWLCNVAVFVANNCVCEACQGLLPLPYHAMTVAVAPGSCAKTRQLLTYCKNNPCGPFAAVSFTFTLY